VQLGEICGCSWPGLGSGGVCEVEVTVRKVEGSERSEYTRRCKGTESASSEEDTTVQREVSQRRALDEIQRDRGHILWVEEVAGQVEMSEGGARTKTVAKNLCVAIRP